MVVILDIQHAGKPNHLADRGASWRGVEEVALTRRYAAEADHALRGLGHDVVVLSDGLYSARWVRAHMLRGDAYVALHTDAGLAGRAPDRGTVISDYRSARGGKLAFAVAQVCTAALPWPVTPKAGRPDRDGQPRDEDLTEAYNCISGLYELRPVGITFEPGFIDGALGQDWLRNHAEDVGTALAQGVHAWSTTA